MTRRSIRFFSKGWRANRLLTLAMDCIPMPLESNASSKAFFPTSARLWTNSVQKPRGANKLRVFFWRQNFPSDRLFAISVFTLCLSPSATMIRGSLASTGGIHAPFVHGPRNPFRSRVGPFPVARRHFRRALDRNRKLPSDLALHRRYRRFDRAGDPCDSRKNPAATVLRSEAGAGFLRRRQAQGPRRQGQASHTLGRTSGPTRKAHAPHRHRARAAQIH